MKRLFIKISVFFLLFFIVDKPVGYLISEGASKKQYDRRMALLCRGDISADIMITGSSRAVNDLDAKAIGELTGMSCYNLGYSGSNLLFHESVLKIALESGLHPKKLLLTMDHGNTFKDVEQSIYRKDKLQPFVRFPQVYRELCEHSNKIYWLGRFFWMYRENDNLFPSLTYLKKGVDEADITSKVDERGSIILQGRSPKFNIIRQTEKEEEYREDEELPELITSFESVVNICKKENIQLYLIIPPALKLHFRGFVKSLEDLNSGRAVILDFSEMDMDEYHYYDNGHLNEKGAASLASAIAENL